MQKTFAFSAQITKTPKTWEGIFGFVCIGQMIVLKTSHHSFPHPKETTRPSYLKIISLLLRSWTRKFWHIVFIFANCSHLINLVLSTLVQISLLKNLLVLLRSILFWCLTIQEGEGNAFKKADCRIKWTIKEDFCKLFVHSAALTRDSIFETERRGQ